MRLLLDVSAVPRRPVGAGVYTVALASGLARDPGDLELVLLARRDDTARWRDLAPACEVQPLVPQRRPQRLLWEQLEGPRVAARLGIDVWHGPHYTCPLRTSIPRIVTIHDLTFFDHPEVHERTKVRYFRGAIRASSRRADRLICVSEHTAARLHAIVPDHAPIVVVPHGVDHARFHPIRGTCEVVDDERLLAMHGIDGPMIAFVGTIEPRKELATLISAFSRLVPSHPHLRLVLAGGDGWGAAQVRAAIADSGVGSRILRPGYLSDDAVAALYRQADVIAYPSRAEGFGLPALEALASGAALVTTVGTAMDEFVGDAALQCSPGDAAGLAAALERALEPDTAATLRRLGPQCAAPYTWEASVTRHRDAYHEALLSTAP